uniref:Uncharacterized protein n=1 Tax=Glossina austeni TaxID=7395 RepID=A0A1A9V4X0_GLOAU
MKVVYKEQCNVHILIQMWENLIFEVPIMVCQYGNTFQDAKTLSYVLIKSGTYNIMYWTKRMPIFLNLFTAASNCLLFGWDPAFAFSGYGNFIDLSILDKRGEMLRLRIYFSIFFGNSSQTFRFLDCNAHHSVYLADWAFGLPHLQQKSCGKYDLLSLRFESSAPKADQHFSKNS